VTPQLARKRVREALSAQADAACRLFPKMTREEATKRATEAFRDPSRPEWDAGLAAAAEAVQPLIRAAKAGADAPPGQEVRGRKPSGASSRGLLGVVEAPGRPARTVKEREPEPRARARDRRPRAAQGSGRQLETDAPAGRFLSRSASFEDAGLGYKLRRRLSSLGFGRPSVVQARSLPPALAGRHCVIHAETGSGKTLAYALPLLQRIEGLRSDGTGPLGLVLVPSQELAEQVAAVLAVLDPSSTPLALHGAASPSASRALADGSAPHRVVVATPQALLRVLRRPSRKAVSCLARVRVVAVDETDFLLASSREHTEACLWLAGQPSREMREARARAADAAAAAGASSVDAVPMPRPGPGRGVPRLGRDSSAQFLFAAATLSDKTHRTVGEWFRRHFEGAEMVRTAGAHRAVLTADLTTVVVDTAMAIAADAASPSAEPTPRSALLAEARLAAVVKAVRSHGTAPGGTTLVFAGSKAEAEAAAGWLSTRVGDGWGGASGVRVEVMHKGLPQGVRRDVAAELVGPAEAAAGPAGGGPEAATPHVVLVATDLAARGLDTRRVGHVVNAWLPTDAATFLHRAGRTARAGGSGRVTTVVLDTERERAAELFREAAAGGEDTVTARSAALDAGKRRSREGREGRGAGPGGVKSREGRGAGPAAGEGFRGGGAGRPSGSGGGLGGRTARA